MYMAANISTCATHDLALLNSRGRSNLLSIAGSSSHFDTTGFETIIPNTSFGNKFHVGLLKFTFHS